LKTEDNKAEERASKTGYFQLTNMQFRFMIVSVPGLTERLAKQGEDGFRASIRSENRKSARRGAKGQSGVRQGELIVMKPVERFDPEG
jgi:hypothetical protein